MIQHTYNNVWVVNKNYFLYLAFPFQHTIYMLSFVVKFVISNGYTRVYYSFFFPFLQILFIISVAISFVLSLFFRLLVPKWRITVSGELSLKNPLTWCFITFVVAPGIDFTWTVDFILLLSLHPSIFFTIESPVMNALFLLLHHPHCVTYGLHRYFCSIIFFHFQHDNVCGKVCY